MNSHYINVLYHVATIRIEVSSTVVLSLATTSRFYSHTISGAVEMDTNVMEMFKNHDRNHMI